MSLINQMLRDLETRRADSSEKSSLPNEVRSLPQAPKENAWPKVIVVTGGVALLAVLLWWVVGRISTAPVAAAPPPVPAVVKREPILKLDPDLLDARIHLPKNSVVNTSPTTPSVEPEKTPSIYIGPEKFVPVEHTKTQIEKKPPGSDLISTPLQRAREQLAAGQRDTAEATLRQGLVNSAAPVPLRQLLFGLLLEQHRNDDALITLQEGLSTHPEQTQWATNAARMQIDSGDLPGAWDTLQRSLPHAENLADYRAFCGTLLSRMKRYPEAVEHYRVALALNPGEGRWWIGLALALEADGKLTESKSAFASAKATGKLSPELSVYVDNKLR